MLGSGAGAAEPPVGRLPRKGGVSIVHLEAPIVEPVIRWTLGHKWTLLVSKRVEEKLELNVDTVRRGGKDPRMKPVRPPIPQKDNPRPFWGLSRLSSKTQTGIWSGRTMNLPEPKRTYLEEVCESVAGVLEGPVDIVWQPLPVRDGLGVGLHHGGSLSGVESPVV